MTQQVSSISLLFLFSFMHYSHTFLTEVSFFTCGTELPGGQPVALSHIVTCVNEIYGDKKQDQIEADEALCLYKVVEKFMRL